MPKRKVFKRELEASDANAPIELQIDEILSKLDGRSCEWLLIEQHQIFPCEGFVFSTRESMMGSLMDALMLRSFLELHHRGAKLSSDEIEPILREARAGLGPIARARRWKILTYLYGNLSFDLESDPPPILGSAIHVALTDIRISPYGRGLDRLCRDNIIQAMSFKSTQPIQLLLSFAFLVATLCTSFSQTSNSLVQNTWQVSITRISSKMKETGTAFVNFNANGTYSGYGITTLSGPMFTFSGTWQISGSGQVTGDYDQSSSISGFVTGKATSKNLALVVTATDGTYKLNGKPVHVSDIPDFSGSWGVSFTILHTTSFELISVIPLEGYPGVFQYTGNSTDVVSGQVILTGSGQMTAYLYDLSTTDAASMTGKFNASKQTANLSGRDWDNLSVKAKLFRQ